MTCRIIFLFIAMACIPALLRAGEVEPRSYVNTPVGVNFMLLGYAYSEGGLSTEGASPITDAELDTHTVLLAYAHSLEVMGKSAKVDVIVPYSDLSGSALFSGQPREREVDGLHDPRFRFSINLYGAPALSLQEFSHYQQDLIIGASLQVSPPLGQYDKNKLVNLGTNRWFVKPGIGISQAWGALTLELSGSVFLYTDKHDNFGNTTLEQDPLYATQAHLTYNIKPGIWAAVSATIENGGRTRVDGVKNDDEQENTRLGVTLAASIDKNHSIKLYANNALHTRVGTDYDLVGVAWQYRWGGGL